MPSGSHWEYFNWVVYYEDVEVDRFFLQLTHGNPKPWNLPRIYVGYNL